MSMVFETPGCCREAMIDGVDSPGCCREAICAFFKLIGNRFLNKWAAAVNTLLMVCNFEVVAAKKFTHV